MNSGAIDAAIAGGATVTISAILPGKAICRATAEWKDGSFIVSKPGLGSRGAMDELDAAIRRSPEYATSLQGGGK